MIEEDTSAPVSLRSRNESGGSGRGEGGTRRVLYVTDAYVFLLFLGDFHRDGQELAKGRHAHPG